ncbi:hypothetical protein [Acetobacterium wieringae]|uniref:hypothetical protein n=1 Tax=Acetobacterium wieringae TaxID=52694 RepID=UPI0026EAC3F1|nr:hypothetical protein [Acetobacterium wieringae]
MLNSVQVKELFEKEAVLFGNADGVLINRAIELFGKKAVDFGSNYLNGWASGFGIGDFTAYYLKFSGFQQAATFANVEEIQRIIKSSRKKESIKS